MVRVWSGGTGGAFSTLEPFSLDTGGDAILDATQGLDGVDPDTGLAVPPAVYRVDFVDGGAHGPATITVVSTTAVDDAAAAALRFLRVHPVPSGTTVAIRFELAAAALVRLSVYDLNGRLVRALIESPTLLARGPQGVE